MMRAPAAASYWPFTLPYRQRQLQGLRQWFAQGAQNKTQPAKNDTQTNTHLRKPAKNGIQTDKQAEKPAKLDAPPSK